MITQAFLIRLYASSAIVAAVLAAASWFVWQNIAFPAGLALGALIGLAPFASWHLILMKSNGFQNPQRGWIVAITLTKYAAISGLVYLAAVNHWVQPFALIAGILVPMVMLWVLGAARMFSTPNHKVL